MAFGLGSQVGLPLVNKSGNPLNGFEVAQNVAEVLAYDSSIRYIGMAVYCIDEGAVYRFKSGITNADFVKDSSAKEEVSAIYEDYSLFPITLDREVIVYAKNDYEDIATSTIYKNGFYIYKLDTNTWELIGGSGDLETEKEEDPVYVETVTIDDTDEDIEATKTVQIVGMEETTILVANQDSADGTTIKAGDVISITKVINGIEVYSYHILDDNELYNPFE